MCLWAFTNNFNNYFLEFFQKHTAVGKETQELKDNITACKKYKQAIIVKVYEISGKKSTFDSSQWERMWFVLCNVQFQIPNY